MIWLILIGLLVPLVLVLAALHDHRRVWWVGILFHLFLGLVVVQYVGLGQGETPWLSPRENLRLEHLGYYVGTEHEALFTAEPKRNGFPNRFFAQTDTLVLKPLWEDETQREVISAWNLSIHLTHQPLRWGRQAINVPYNQWLNDGDVLQFTNDSLRLVLTWDLSKTLHEDTLAVRLAVFDRNRDAADTLLWNPVFAQTYPFRPIREAWPLINVISDRRWRPLISQIFLVRERKGDLSTRLGYLVASEAFEDRQLAMQHNGVPLSPQTLYRRLTQMADQTLVYGYGNTNLWRLKLGTRSTKLEKGPVAPSASRYVATMEFVVPLAWTLPEDHAEDQGILLTSSSRHTQFRYAYQIDQGKHPSPFYVWGNWNASLDRLSINTGDRNLEVLRDETFYLGNGPEEGVSLRYTVLKASVPYAGVWALAALLVGLLAFLGYYKYFGQEGKSDKPHLESYWLLLWLVFLAILTVRLILSYRLGLLPPVEGRIGDYNSFRLALPLALFALFALPFLFVLVRAIAGLKLYARIIHGVQNRDWWGYVALVGGALVLGYPLLGRILGGSNQDFLGMRINLISLILLFACLMLLTKWIDQQEDDEASERNHWISPVGYGLFAGITVAATLLITVTQDDLSMLLLWGGCLFVLVMFGLLLFRKTWVPPLFVFLLVGCTIGINFIFVGDTGFIIYFPVFAVGFLMWTYWEHRDDSRTARVMKWALLALVLLTFPAIKYLPHLITVRPIERVLLADADEAYFRLAAFVRDREAMLSGIPLQGEEFELFKLRRNTEQQWQMLNYASHGGLVGYGYAKTPNSNVGMSYPTSITDCVFAMHVLAEHGWMGALFVLVLFGLVFVCCLTAAFRISREDAHRSWLIGALGAFWLLTTLYMAGANVGLFPFTGQNIPLLSLYSGSDLLQAGLLIGLLGLLMHDMKELGEADAGEWKEDFPEPYRVTLIFLFILPALVLLVLGRSYGVAANDAYRKDHRLSSDFVAAMQSKLVDGKVPQGVVLNRLEQYMVDQVSALSGVDNQDAAAAIYYVDDQGRYRVNRDYLTLRSPFNRTEPWKGRILAQVGNNNLPVVRFLNQSIRLGLDTTSVQPTTLYLNRDTTYTRTHSEVLLVSQPGDQTLTQLSVIGTGDSMRIVVTPYRGGEVYVNGDPLETAQPRTLEAQDIVLLKAKADDQRYYLLNEGIQPPLLAYTSWVNGKDRRVFPEGDIFPMAYVLGKIADRAGTGPFDVHLSINIEYQHELQRIIREYAQNQPPYRLTPLQSYDRARQIGLTVMDPVSGEIVALGSWPNADPNDPDFEDYLQRVPVVRREDRVLRNPNLRLHHIGSTTKPLTFAALATQMPAGYDLASLQIYHPQSSREALDENANLDPDDHFNHPHLYLAGVRLGSVWGCRDSYIRWGTWIDHRDYLTWSQNYFQMALTLLGLTDPRDSSIPLQVTKGDQSTRYRFGVQRVGYLDLGGSKFISERENQNRPRNLNTTRLFVGLDSLFNVYPDLHPESDRYDTISVVWQQEATRFLPDLAVHGGRTNTYLKLATPTPVKLGASTPDDINYVKAFGRGAGFNTWNNVTLAEAMSRLITGTAVEATLQKRDSIPAWLDLPAPMHKDSRWREQNLVAILENVIRGGTARSLNSLPFLNEYRLVAKTGTIEERDGRRDSEMLIFALGQRTADNTFVPGKTFAGYLYMEEAPNLHNNDKFILGRPLIQQIKEFLDERPIIVRQVPGTPQYQPTTREQYTPGSRVRRAVLDAMDSDSPTTRNYAVSLAADSPGSFNIGQVLSIFDYTYSNWNYVNDPSGGEYFANASESIANGLAGDCDDFAILIAAAIEAVGGYTHVVLAFNSREGSGHAYTELLIRGLGSQTDLRQAIVAHYRQRGRTINESDIHFRSQDGNLWLNLDWWGGHVGGRYFEADDVRYVEP